MAAPFDALPGAAARGTRFRASRKGLGLLRGFWALRVGGPALTISRKGVEAVVGSVGAAANAGLCITLTQAQTLTAREVSVAEGPTPLARPHLLTHPL